MQTSVAPFGSWEAICYLLAGTEGLVWVMALSEIPALLILWIPLYREKLLRIERELLALALFGAGVAIGALLKLPLEALTAGL